MTKDERKAFWRAKTDDELIVASRSFSRCSEDAEEIIREEMRQRGIPEPEPTIRNSSLSANRLNWSMIGNSTIIKSMNPTRISAIGVVLGIIMLMVGMVMIRISPYLVYQQQGGAISIGGYETTGHFIETVTFYGDLAYLGGILVIFVGVVGAAVGGLFFITQTVKPISSTVQDRAPVSFSTRSIGLGDTIEKVQRVMGKPEKIIDLRTQVIHVYKDMKIVYINGTVSDVQLS